MISAVEARKLKENIWCIQLEQIERAIKETITIGGTCIGYKTDALDERTIEWLKILGYNVQTSECIDNSTIISWEE